MLVLTPAAPIPLLSHRATVLWCRWGVRPLHFIETHPASNCPVVACRGKMWQEVAQTKKSRGMVAISSKDVKDCERIVEEVELCRRVRAEMASECWLV